MKKVLILFTGIFESGGLETYDRHLCDAIEKEFDDHEFIAISLNDVRQDEHKKWRNIRIKFCDWINIRFIRKAVFFYRTFVAVLRERPDFLICGHMNLSPLAFFFKELFKLRYIVLTYGIDVWGVKNGLRYEGLRNAGIITAMSRYTRSRMGENNIAKDKIKVLQDCIDAALFYPKKPPPELKNKFMLDNKRILLTIGRMSSKEKYKGHDIMLEVLKKLGNEYVWLVIGEGDDLPRLQRKAKEMEIIGKIRFLGHIENNKLVDYYSLCDCFVMPSKGEGFGIVYLEAMACGKPVIAGNRDGSTEPLMDGRLGFLIDPDNVDEIIKAINYVCTVKENRTNPEYLRKQVEANFGIEVFNKRVKEIFGAIVENV